MANKPQGIAPNGSESTVVSFPPRRVIDEHGHTIGVMLAYDDYQIFLRLLASHADWTLLPPYLQNAVDNMLADEAVAEEGPSRLLADVLAETPD